MCDQMGLESLFTVEFFITFLALEINTFLSFKNSRLRFDFVDQNVLMEVRNMFSILFLGRNESLASNTSNTGIILVDKLRQSLSCNLCAEKKKK